MIKRFVAFLAAVLFVGLFISQGSIVFAQEKAVTLHVFVAEGCPHCAAEKKFLKEYFEDSSLLEVREYEITKSRDNAMLMVRVGQALGADVSGVPFTVVGNQYVSGFHNAETTGKEIDRIVKKAQLEDLPDVVALVESGGEVGVSPTPTPDAISSPSSFENTAEEKRVFSVPFLGEITAGEVSLPLLTAAVALVDGFNPCAMWALIFLIGLLLGIEDRRKMWIYGTVFILTSGVVYFLFMTAWLNLFLFIGMVAAVRVGIGLFAGGVGLYQINEYRKERAGVCKISTSGWREKALAKLKEIVEGSNFYTALVGIVALAGLVNLIEFACSAGLPAIYTSILSLSDLNIWQYYAYLLLYIFFFMLDDMAVFAVAMVTLKMTGLQTKYAKYSKLVGGVVMAVLGFLLLFKPEWLMFG